MLDKHKVDSRVVRYFIVVVLASLFVPGCDFFRKPAQYQATPIKGRVVDAATNEGIGNVVVAAFWGLYSGFQDLGFVGYLEVKETLSDKDGNFVIDGWGPRSKSEKGVITDDQPVLIFL